MGFEPSHHFAHVANTLCASLGQGLINQPSELALVQLLGEVSFQDFKRGRFFLNQIVTTAFFKLLDLVSALLDHFLDDRKHFVLIQFDTFIDFAALDSGT